MKGNFEKFPFVRFSKKRLFEWAKEKYFDSEARNQNSARDAYNMCAVYFENGEDQKAFEIQEEYSFEPHYDVMFELIKNFTMKDSDESFHKSCVDVLKIAGIEVIQSENLLTISYSGESFNVMKFSDFDPSIRTELKNIDTPMRVGRCHPYSVITAIKYADNQNFETHLVTGMVYQLSEKAKYLHSWVEVFDGVETYVIDASKNLVMKKEPYYEINHVDEVEKIHSSEVVQDNDIIKRLTDYNQHIVKVYYDCAENGRRLYRMLVLMGEIKEPQPLSV